MPLATKNGALIVKDGKLAENCGCCGGFTCDNFYAFTVTAKASNFVPSGVGLSKIDNALPWIDLNAFAVASQQQVSMPFTLNNELFSSFTRAAKRDYAPNGGTAVIASQPDSAVFCKVKYAEASRPTAVNARDATSTFEYLCPSAEAIVGMELTGTNAYIEFLLCGRANFTGQKIPTRRVSFDLYANFATGFSVYSSFAFSGAGTYSLSGRSGISIFGTEDSWTADIEVVVS